MFRWTDEGGSGWTDSEFGSPLYSNAGLSGTEVGNEYFKPIFVRPPFVTETRTSEMLNSNPLSQKTIALDRPEKNLQCGHSKYKALVSESKKRKEPSDTKVSSKKAKKVQKQSGEGDDKVQQNDNNEPVAGGSSEPVPSRSSSEEEEKDAEGVHQEQEEDPGK